ARWLREQASVMNVDVGGGTSKIAICRDGEVREVPALEVGARLICFDSEGRINRIEEAGRRFAAELGFDLAIGKRLSAESRRALASRMADRLFEAMHGGTPSTGSAMLFRLEPLSASAATVDQVTFSGGVAEYVYAREQKDFGDLGPLLAEAIRIHLRSCGRKLAPPNEGIRATVIGASQYTTQVSGGTIYVSPLSVLPLRNVPVVAPFAALDAEAIDVGAVARAIRALLQRLGLSARRIPVALLPA